MSQTHAYDAHIIAILAARGISAEVSDGHLLVDRDSMINALMNKNVPNTFDRDQKCYDNIIFLIRHSIEEFDLHAMWSVRDRDTLGIAVYILKD